MHTYMEHAWLEYIRSHLLIESTALMICQLAHRSQDGSWTTQFDHIYICILNVNDLTIFMLMFDMDIDYV